MMPFFRITHCFNNNNIMISLYKERERVRENIILFLYLFSLFDVTFFRKYPKQTPHDVVLVARGGGASSDDDVVFFLLVVAIVGACGWKRDVCPR